MDIRDSLESRIQDCLGQLAAGNEVARQAVLELVSERLYRLTRIMFHQFPALRNWEETPDIHQRAMLRLFQALGEVRPENTRQLLNLAALQVKRILLDLARQYGAGASGNSRYPVPVGNRSNLQAQLDEKQQDESLQPGTLDGWTILHQKIGELPPAEREVAMLLFYDGLDQEEIASVMEVSVRTVKRLWQSAKIILRATMDHPDAT